MKLGRASDIWSLGCILYQIAYGHAPFSKLSLVQKMHAITNADLTIDYDHHEDHAAIEAIKLCLRRSPGERATIPKLLSHRFLVISSSSPPSNGAVDTVDAQTSTEELANTRTSSSAETQTNNTELLPTAGVSSDTSRSPLASLTPSLSAKVNNAPQLISLQSK